MEQIDNPKIGSIVYHTGWRFGDNPNYPCDVYIVEGYYEFDGRISNFWYWRRVLSDGTLSNTIENGYGSFEKASKDYKIKITLE